MPTLLELLTAENVTEFNATRGERSRVDLFAADLAEKSLPEVDLSGADVDKADLTGSDLTQAGLYKARMNGIDGTGMKLVDCIGNRVKLREAWLDQADLSGSDFANADLSEAVVTKTKGVHLRLTEAKLKAIDAKEASWPEVDLTGALLSKGDFTGADFSRADLSDAKGGEIVWVKATLSAAKASMARFPGSDFTGANLSGAKFDGANLSDCNFTDANLTGADLTGANLANAVLTGATLTGCVMSEASMDGVDLSGLDLTEVDFTGLDPDLLGLSEEQLDQVLVVGIVVNPDARLKPQKIAVARSGDLLAGVWRNDDGDELATIRYFVRTKKGVTHGVVPVTEPSVMAITAVANGKNVDLVLVRERPGGITLDRFSVGKDGKLADASTSPLGYQPLVVPVLQADGDKVRMWGLARRGPTLVITSDTEEGFQPVGSKSIPTARGFLGRHQPFLTCKGGVVMPCTATGAGNPLKAPVGFPGKFASPTPFDGRWLAVWVEPPEGRNKGGIRSAWLGSRGAPEIEPVTNNGAVLSLDALPDEKGVWVAWIELHGVGDTKVLVQCLPDGAAKELPIEDVDDVRFAPGPGKSLVIACTTDDERIVFVTVDGKELGRLEE